MAPILRITSRTGTFAHHTGPHPTRAPAGGRERGQARNKTQFTGLKYQLIKVVGELDLEPYIWRLVGLPYVLLFASSTGACPSKGLSMRPMLLASMPLARITVRSPKRLRMRSIAW